MLLIMAKAKYKPLSFSTTMRNPARIASFLNCILPFEGKILTNEVIFHIIKTILRNKLYKPNIIAQDSSLKIIYENEEQYFSDEDLNYIINNSTQKHKEAGFDKGWPSRFDTMYKLSMEFGFLQYSIGTPIIISKTGHLLIDVFNQTPQNELMIQNIFLNALIKYPINNPYRKILNDNIPLILLLQVIKILKDYNPDSYGLYRQELSFLICWPNHDAETLALYITKFRNIYRCNYSDEIIYEHCLSLLGASIEQSNYFKMSKITGEAVDEYIRKMRSTGIISLRGNGRFIDLNTLESEKIDYILKNYPSSMKFDNINDYFKYMGTIDKNIISIPQNENKETHTKIKIKALKKYAKSYTKEYIYEELLKVCQRRNSSDPILKFIEAPTRFEFLTSIALVQNFKKTIVCPNYVTDDEGLPIRHASGGKADIICLDCIYKGLVEVTLMLGRQQTNNEILPITRHLEQELKERDNVISLFIAPHVFADAKRMAKWIKHEEHINIKTYDIQEFLNILNKYTSLDDMVSSEIEIA